MLFVGITVSVRNVSSSGAIVLSSLDLFSLNSSLACMITTWTSMETSLGAVARLKDLEMDTPKEDQDCEMVMPQSSWLQHGKIVFDKVEAGYGYVLQA